MNIQITDSRTCLVTGLQELVAATVARLRQFAPGIRLIPEMTGLKAIFEITP